jgi:hypothetical protein
VITVDPTTNHQQSNHYAPPSTEGYASNANAGTLRRNHSSMSN